MKKLVFLIITLCLTTSAQAKTFYLTATGNGTKDGSSLANAFSPDEFNDAANWDTAADNDTDIGPGDTVVLSGVDGYIADTDSGDSDYHVLEIQGSGMPTSPITITADQSSPPVIYGAESIHTWDWQKIDFIPGGAEPWDETVDNDGPVTFAIDGASQDNGTYNYTHKTFSGTHSQIRIECDIWPYVTCDNESRVTVLSLQDNATQRAVVELQCTKSGASQYAYDLRYTVFDDSSDNKTTGWQDLGVSGFFPVHSLVIYYEQDSSFGEAWVKIDDTTHAVADSGSLDNDEQDIDRLLAGAVSHAGTPAGIFALYGFVMIGNGDEGTGNNIYRSTKRPSQLWDTLGTTTFDDDTDVLENNNLTQLADNESGWWYGYTNAPYTYVKLTGSTSPTSQSCGIVGSVARGLVFDTSGKSSDYHYEYITIDGGSGKIGFEKCGGYRDKYYQGALVFQNHPTDDLLISNCEINRSMGTGIIIDGGKNISIFKNKVDISLARWNNTGGEGTGIAIADRSVDKGMSYYPEDLKIYDNEVSRCYHPGIFVAGGHNIAIHDNYLHDLPHPNPNPDTYWPISAGTNIHLEMEGTNYDGIKVYNNLLENTHNGIKLSGPGKNIDIFNNIIVRQQSARAYGIGVSGSQNVNVVNNTIIAPQGDGIKLGAGIFDEEDDNIILKNNIIYEPGGYLINAAQTHKQDPGYWTRGFVDFVSTNNCLYDDNETWQSSYTEVHCALSSETTLLLWEDYSDNCTKPTGVSIRNKFNKADSFTAKFDTTPDNETCEGMQTTVAAYTNNEITAIDDTFTIHLNTVLKTLGTWTDNETTTNYFNVQVDNGEVLTDIYFSKDGIRVDNGTTYHFAAVDDMKLDKWYKWQFKVRSGTGYNPPLLSIYLEREPIVEDKAWLNTASTEDGRIAFVQYSGSEEQVNHFKSITITTDVISSTDWTDAGYDNSSRFTDPQIVDINGGDYRLESDSPCIDTGTAIDNMTSDFYANSRPCGDGYDIGAHEYTPDEVCDDEIDNDCDGLVDCDDPDCDDPPLIIDGPLKVSNSEELSDNASAPTSVAPVIWAVAWEFADDYATNDCCSTPPTVAWDYRTSDNESWVQNAAQRFTSYGIVHFDQMDDGTYQFKASVTDCDNQTTYSTVRYITIE